MYLVKINSKTGLVDISDEKDGVLAIPAFRAVIEKYGVPCFTCIALTVDYLSPIRFFKYEERHIKAMKEVVGNRDAFAWGEDVIQEALLAYQRLQNNPTLQELEILKDMRLKKIEEIEAKENSQEKLKLFKELNEIKENQDAFEKRADMASALSEAPTINGYTLSRLEELLTSNKSFYHEQKSL